VYAFFVISGFLIARRTRGALDGQEIWQEKAYLPAMSAMSAIALGVLAARLRILQALGGASEFEQSSAPGWVQAMGMAATICRPTHRHQS